MNRYYLFCICLHRLQTPLLWMAFVVLALAFAWPPPVVKAKEVEEKLARYSDSFYVGKGELTNGEYNLFLSQLRANGQQQLADAYRLDSTAWYGHLDAYSLSQHYHRHTSYNDYPVVAISFEAAIAYCGWLTEQYMMNGKRKFARVRFRLPTEHEWQEAAYAGDHGLRYAWGNYLIRRTGEQMANYRKISDQRIHFDSASSSYQVVISPEEVVENNWRPERAITFWPNQLGIYNQCGNVAEMVAEIGWAKGGSFNDPGYDIQITSKKYYTKPTREIGFRVVMELLP